MGCREPGDETDDWMGLLYMDDPNPEPPYKMRTDRLLRPKPYDCQDESDEEYVAERARLLEEQKTAYTNEINVLEALWDQLKAVYLASIAAAGAAIEEVNHEFHECPEATEALQRGKALLKHLDRGLEAYVGVTTWPHGDLHSHLEAYTAMTFLLSLIHI